MLALFALVPIGFGAHGLVTGAAGMDVADPAAAALLDNKLRFLYAIWFSVGVLLLAMLPRIEQHTFATRFIGLAVFLGGVGRLVSVLVVGAALPRLWASMVVELAVVPLLVWWQARVARDHAATDASRGG
jgi:L-lactate permease